MTVRRTIAALALGSLAWLAGACGDGGDGGAATQAATRPPPARDPRIDYLLVPGARTEHYDVDTSDATSILTENLLRGQRDPLRRAREELGAMGEEGLRVAQRVIDSYFQHPDGFAPLQNALEVVHRSDAPGARELCLRMLLHPNDSLRKSAIDALVKHGRPEDYDALYATFETISPEFKQHAMLALEKLDPVRAQEQYLTWIENAEYRAVWDKLMPCLARAENRVVLARLSKLWPKLEGRHRKLAAAACARAGDETALELLRAALASEEPGEAEDALAALVVSGMEDELDRVARTHASRLVRELAMRSLATPGAAGRHVEALRAGLSSTDEETWSACLTALAAVRDEIAIERALAVLSDPASISLATPMNALSAPMQGDPLLAGRVLEALTRRRDPESHLDVDEQVQVLRSISQVPLRGAAELLHEMSKTATGEIQGMPAGRWLVELVGNTGEPGQRLLASELPQATDPLRRLDLIEGISMRGGPFALQTLLALAESETCGPYEILYVADRLTRIGTVAEVAPVLKRATLRVEQPDVRIALQSFLWFHYPGPR